MPLVTLLLNTLSHEPVERQTGTVFVLFCPVKFLLTARWATAVRFPAGARTFYTFTPGVGRNHIISSRYLAVMRLVWRSFYKHNNQVIKMCLSVEVYLRTFRTFAFDEGR
jgi:hypothetical protein